MMLMMARCCAAVAESDITSCNSIANCSSCTRGRFALLMCRCFGCALKIALNAAWCCVPFTATITTLFTCMHRYSHRHFEEEHTRTFTRLTAISPGLPGWAGTRKVKPVCNLLKQETASDSGISCTSLQSDNHASTPPLSIYRPDALPVVQPTSSKHWWHILRRNFSQEEYYR